MSEHPNLAAALVAGLADLSTVEKNHKANAGQYSYEYADIAAVVAATRPTLAAHGVVALTPVVDNGDGLACTVVLLHSSGERMEFGPFSFPRGKDAQATGSMVTYHRRYALLSALGMAAGDDDGATAQAQQPRQQVIDNSARADEMQDRIALLPEKAQTKILNWFKAPVAEWGTFSDEALDRLADVIARAEKVEASTEPLRSEGGEGSPTSPVDPPAPPVASAEDSTPRPSAEAAAITKPAVNKPSAAARAALEGKPALGATKRTNDAPDSLALTKAAFPDAEEVAS